MTEEEQRGGSGQRNWKLQRRYPYLLLVKRIGDRSISMDDIQASQSTEPTAGETTTGPEPVADEPMPEAAEESPEMDQPAAEQEVEGAKQEGAPVHPKEAQD
ncbi:hypothetical protein RF55_21231 [Lasius niger]|uniref:Uncharacterized protein n=1 Tax=Lasius niger TaxID=67767 RepID=A0A0J7JXU3_LASNI|nr:hypothetical protein RF55_21231 [Lasius niger]